MQLLLFIAAACSQKEDTVLADFKTCEIYSISPIDSIKTDSYGILMPEAIVKHNNYLVLKKHATKNHIDIINMDTNEAIHIAKKGRAKNELINIGSFQYINGYLNVYDPNLRKYIKYNLDSTIVSGNECIHHRQFDFSNVSKDGALIPSVLYEYHDSFITVGLWETNSWYRIMSIDGIFNDGVERIQFKELESYSALEQSSFHIPSVLTVNHSVNKVVSALCMAPALSVSNIQKGKLIETSRKVYSPPIIEPVRKENMPMLKYDASNKRAFCGIHSTDNYIYALYSGKRLDSSEPSYQCNYLLIYDWKLNPISMYIMDQSINSFWIDGKTLWGASSYPDSRIYIYQLVEE